MARVVIRKLLLAGALLCAPTLAVAQATYPTPAGSRVNGVVPLNCDATGANCAPRAQADTAGDYVIELPTSAAAGGTTRAATPVAAADLVVKATAGNLYGFNVVAGASAGFVMVFNAPSTVADGTVTPSKCYPLAANTGIDVNYRGQPSYFASGIVISFSTTGCFTKTGSATAYISANYK